MAPSSWTTVRQLATPGASAVATATCSGPQVKPEHVVGREAAHQQRSGGAADACEDRGPPRGAVVDAVAGDDGLGQAELQLELALLVGMQVVLQRRRHDDLDAHQPLGLGPGDQPAGRGPGDAEPCRDLRLRQSVQVVERGGAQSQAQVLGRGTVATPTALRPLGRSTSMSSRFPPPFSLRAVSICSGVRVDVHHANMPNVTYTTPSISKHKRSDCPVNTDGWTLTQS